MDQSLAPWYRRPIGKTGNLKPRLLNATQRVQSRLPFRSSRRENGLTYKPLDTTKEEFRLLSLVPDADPDNAITCRLFTASLAGEPSYTALSYVWGDPTITKSILVNGIEVQVAVNLEAALRRIREAHEDIIIWVDALCINQSDVHERNTQVTRMREIYSRARLVYAWLGEDTNVTAEAVFQHMSKVSSHFGSQIEEMENFFDEFPKYIKSDLGQKARNSIIESYHTGVLSVSEALWKDLSEFTQRPYWQRMWIQQELLLPHKVSLLCGKFSVSLRDFIVWNESSWQYVYNEPSNFRGSDAVSSTNFVLLRIAPIVRALYLTPKNLASVLATFSGCKATLPHDNIYGALGSYTGYRYITIDYKKPAALAFGEAVRVMAEEDGNLYLRCQPRRRDLQLLRHLPSWTPDFRSSEFAAYITPINPLHRAKIEFTSNPDILRTYGWIIDTVKTVTLFDDSEDSVTANSRIAWAFLQNNVATRNPAGIPFLQAFCRNIFEFRDQRHFLSPMSCFKIRSFLHWVLKMGAGGDDPHYGSPGRIHPQFDNFVKEYGLGDLFESLETLPDEIVLSILFAKYTGAIEHLTEPYKGAKDHNSFSSMTAQQRMAPFWGCDRLPAEFLAEVEWRVEFESHYASFVEQWLQKLSPCSLIVTEQGYVGIATRDASIGDSICLVRGCPHPTLIQSFGNSYEVVGRSFIAALMDDELFKNGNLTEKNDQMLDFV